MRDHLSPTIGKSGQGEFPHPATEAGIKETFDPTFWWNPFEDGSKVIVSNQGLPDPIPILSYTPPAGAGYKYRH